MSDYDAHTVQIDLEHIHVLVWAGLWLEDAQKTPLAWPVVSGNGRVEGLSRLTADTADTVGQMLVDTNTRAVNDDTGQDNLYIYSYREPHHREWNQVEILKAVQFYEYQNTINDDWHLCEAYYFCQVLKSRMMHQLPGFLGAPWHITADILPAQGQPL
ncbi:MAG: hypothetical protein AB7G47_20260 [Mycolicibacterium sp.]|uniref:hypothetical protein n=1 Tax=Mycolicibacterium sp. TaxID=2320850 RepID=UPI003D0B793E